MLDLPMTEVYTAVSGVTALQTVAAVPASAGKKDSMRNFCTVMSCGFVNVTF